MNECLGCLCNQNPSMAPGGMIKEYKYWVLDHIIEPIPHKGWLILRTKRHVIGLTGMSIYEARELATIIYIVPKILQQLMGAEMVYAICIAEDVKHLHFHIIPRMPDDIKSTDLFKKLANVKAYPEHAIDAKDCLSLIEMLKKTL